MICCNTYQLLEPIAQSTQVFLTRTGSPDSMEATASSRLVEGKDAPELIENGKWSKWQFQRQPAVPALHDVQLLDNPNARFRMVAGDLPY